MAQGGAFLAVPSRDRHAPTADRSVCAVSTDDLAEGRRPELARLAQSLRATPALVYSRHLRVVVSNDLACAVAPGFAVGSNLARFTFIDGINEAGVRDRGHKRQQVAAILRESLRRHTEDGAFLDLVGELSATSPAFAESWASRERPTLSGTFEFNHPDVGWFALTFHRFPLRAALGDTLVLWRPADTKAARSLARLRQSLER